MPSKRTNGKPPNVKRTVKRVIMYRRVSKARDHMTTMETQKISVEDFCGRKGWEIVADLADEGISAFDGSERPQYERALEMIERGQADAIVVFRLDRFSRSIKDFVNAWDRIKAAGGSFVSVNEDFDSTNPYMEIVFVLLAAFAQIESQIKSERAIPMHDFQKETGAVGPGPRPYGYNKVTSKETKNSRGNKGAGAILTRNEREAAVIEEAVKCVLSGGSLLSFIAEHSPDSSRANVKMTYRGLRHILTNATTAGLREWDGAKDGTGFTKGNWEPIIAREDWDRVREILLDPSRKTYEGSAGHRRYLLSGVMVCGSCGKGFTSRNWVHPKTREITKRYQCGNVGKCYNSIDAAGAEKVVTEALFEAVPETLWQTWQTKGMGWDDEVTNAIRVKLSNLDGMYFVSEEMEESTYKRGRKILTDRLAAAQDGEPLDIPHVPNLRDSWEGFNLHDKQRVLKQAFREIKLLQCRSRDPRKRIAFDGNQPSE